MNLRICLRWKKVEEKERGRITRGKITTDRSIDVSGDFGESSKIIESQRTIVKDEGVGRRYIVIKQDYVSRSHESRMSRTLNVAGSRVGYGIVI